MPNLSLDQPPLDLFWTFIYERQLIWHKRNVLGEPAPWTEDHVMRDWHFTNVYRELDRGTVFYTDVVVPQMRALNFDDGKVFFATCLYRFFNRIDLWENVLGSALAVIGEPGWFDWLERDVRAQAEAGLKVWTGAYVVCAYATYPGRDKIARVFQFLRALWERRDDFAVESRFAESTEQWHAWVQRFSGIGLFNAYEILSDLLLIKWPPLARFSENDWANPGPGAVMGLKWIWPDVKRKEYQAKMRWLEIHQEDEFDRLRLPFHIISLWDEGEPRWLTMRNIEHCLCEFQKWMKTSHGVGRCRVKFHPRQGSSVALPNLLQT